MFADADRMVRTIQPKAMTANTALAGIVTESGELERRTPSHPPDPSPVHTRDGCTADAIPKDAIVLLRTVLARRTRGLLLLARHHRRALGD